MMKVVCPIHLSGPHADAIADGKALPLAVLVYYPEENKLVSVGMDVRSVEETGAIFKQFLVPADE